MRIAENVEMLTLTGNSGPIYPVLLWNEQDTVLIDCGLPGQFALLTAVLAQAGFAPEQITRLILTHQDIDHIGCAGEFACLGAQILAHETEAPYIQGDKTLIKLAALERELPQLSEEKRAFYERMKQAAPKLAVPVDRLLHDGEILPWCGGIEVIHTPGHMPGHIALLLQESGVLVCGDAANITDGELSGANPVHTQDMAEAEASFTKLKHFIRGPLVCYHGGLLGTPSIKGGR